MILHTSAVYEPWRWNCILLLLMGVNSFENSWKEMMRRIHKWIPWSALKNLIQTHVINGLSGGRAVPGVPCFSWLAQKSKQMKGMLEERHAGGVFVLWTSVTARGCCPSGWYSWTMRLKKFGTQPWQSAYDVWGGSLLTDSLDSLGNNPRHWHYTVIAGSCNRMIFCT